MVLFLFLLAEAVYLLTSNIKQKPNANLFKGQGPPGGAPQWGPPGVDSVGPQGGPPGVCRGAPTGGPQRGPQEGPPGGAPS